MRKLFGCFCLFVIVFLSGCTLNFNSNDDIKESNDNSDKNDENNTNSENKDDSLKEDDSIIPSALFTPGAVVINGDSTSNNNDLNLIAGTYRLSYYVSKDDSYMNKYYCDTNSNDYACTRVLPYYFIITNQSIEQKSDSPSSANSYKVEDNILIVNIEIGTHKEARELGYVDGNIFIVQFTGFNSYYFVFLKENN